jgi:hypothetical protein
VSIVVSSSSSDISVCRLLGSTDELGSGGGVIVSGNLESLCGWSASALRFRFADFDLAMADVVLIIIFRVFKVYFSQGHYSVSKR